MTHTLSLIIPVYNEANHLSEFLSKIDALVLPIEKELVIIDDCSADGSFDIIKSFSFTSKTQIIRQSTNMGKGAALREGIAKANGTIIGIQDADFEYDMNDISSLIAPLVNDRADIVFGSRFKKSSQQVHRTFHYLINRFLTILSNLLCGLYLSDMETCYKFFKAEIIKNILLQSNRFGFEPEVTAKVCKLNVRVFELPISYLPRNYLCGKKITWKDGIAAIGHIIHFNFLKRQGCFTEKMPRKYLSGRQNWL